MNADNGMDMVDTSYNMASSNNEGFNSSAALSVRLDPSYTIENIELFLRGSKLLIERDKKTGRIHQRYISIGRPKANELGIQAILNRVQTIINPQVVQGNFPVDTPHTSQMFETYVVTLQEELSCEIMDNLYYWEIAEQDIRYLVNFIMSLVVPYMTRLIDNKERDSYANTLQYRQHDTVKDKGGGGFTNFFKR